MPHAKQKPTSLLLVHAEGPSMMSSWPTSSGTTHPIARRLLPTWLSTDIPHTKDGREASSSRVNFNGKSQRGGSEAGKWGVRAVGMEPSPSTGVSHWKTVSPNLFQNSPP